jgi:hypothetical protein
VGFVWGFGGAYPLGLYWEKEMNGGIEVMLVLWNVLIIPAVVYIVRLEKRLVRIEEVLKTLCKKEE